MQKPPTRNVELDALVLGGGVTGLWILDALVRAGHRAVLVEATALGDGQSICAQGILHGGTKYMLSALVKPGPNWLKQMPGRWADALEGRSSPDLSAVTVRTRNCHLWRTESLKSIAGMVGARSGLQVRPQRVDDGDRPAVLAHCPGDVATLGETVIETPSLMAALGALHPGRVIKARLTEADLDAPDGGACTLELPDGSSIVARTRNIVLAAGGGTPALLELLQADSAEFTMQRRPLHMAMVRGEQSCLPELNGHCVDGGKTRVTITSSTARNGDRVWQLGGELAETGCSKTPEQLIKDAATCLAEVLPGFQPANDGLSWATYTIDRAENRSPRLARPNDSFVGSTTKNGTRIVVSWPTKMVLAPRAADKTTALLGEGPGAGDPPLAVFEAPLVALPPWEHAECN